MIKKFFEKDSVLKIVSVFVAILVWLYVIYIEDPEIETTIDDVAVTFDKAQLDDNLSVIALSNETVDVKIKGDRSDVMEIEEDDINAVLDLSSVDKAGEYKNVRLNLSTGNKRVEIVDSSESKLTVQIDDIISRKFDIEVEFENDMPSGYIVTDSPSLNTESVWVKGARSYIEMIKGAYIKIDCTGLSQNKTVDGEIYLKDKDGKTVDKKHKAFKHLEISEETVSAYVKVGKTKTAEVEVLESGDFEVISVSPQEIEIYSANGRVDKVYTKSIKNKEPDKDGFITVKLDVPDYVILVNPSQTVKIQVENK